MSNDDPFERLTEPTAENPFALAPGTDGETADAFARLARRRRRQRQWKWVTLGVLFLVLGGVAVFCIFFRRHFVREDLGQRLVITPLSHGAEEIYYGDGATEEQAHQLGAFLKQSGLFDGRNSKTVRLAKNGAGFVVQFVIADGMWDNQAVLELMQKVRAAMSRDLFGGAAVEVHLCEREVGMKQGELALIVRRTLK